MLPTPASSSSPSPSRTPHPITPRKVVPQFAGVPRHWFGGSAVATHITNGVNMLFPQGERFFVRSVKHFLDRIEDPELRDQIRGFFGQEGRHASAHDDYNDHLRAQGFRIDRFLEIHDRICYDWLERLTTPELRLAATAAAEHYTAILAEGAFTGQTFDAAHPVMRELLLWHAAEEIEHKSVAFDVLQKVDDSYFLRLSGFALASAVLLSFWTIGAIMLMVQDEDATWERIRRDFRGGRRGGFLSRGDVVRRVMAFTRPNFHPWSRDNLDLAMAYLARAKASSATA